MASFTIAALRAHLDADPDGRGYSTMQNSAVVESMNLVRAGKQVDVTFRQAWELQAAVVASEYAALTQTSRDLWQAILIGGQIRVKDPTIRGQITTIWSAPTDTRANLGALQTRDGSDAEFLWGDGISVTLNSVREARAL